MTKKRLLSGEVVSKIWWVQILQENSYPNIDEYDFSWKTRTQVRFLQENSYPGTTSPGELVPRYDFSKRSRTQFFGYDFSWVRLLLGTTSPDTAHLSRSFRRLKVKHCGMLRDKLLNERSLGWSLSKNDQIEHVERWNELNRTLYLSMILVFLNRPRILLAMPDSVQ